uniref:Helicase C-terminal domain-containing protein n=1 Tax=Panagrolaimus superbus TaxID=310955 RepID=A0A914Y2K8_9BILA
MFLQDVFFQSIESLKYVENSLVYSHGWHEDHKVKYNECREWKARKDYFVIDGKVPNQEREKFFALFNDIDNHRARLLLLSKRCGSVGLNLLGANRMVIFEPDWNPCNDDQSVGKIYRFGRLPIIWR